MVYVWEPTIVSDDMSSEPESGVISVDALQLLYRALLIKRFIQIGDDGTRSVARAAFRPKEIDKPISVDIAELTTIADSLKKFKPETGLAGFLCQIAIDVGCRVIRELDLKQPENLAYAHIYLPEEADQLDIATAKLADACTILVEYDRKRTTHIVSESQDGQN